MLLFYSSSHYFVFRAHRLPFDVYSKSHSSWRGWDLVGVRIDVDVALLVRQTKKFRSLQSEVPIREKGGKERGRDERSAAFVKKARESIS